MSFRLPDQSQHTFVTGRNGTGKTRLAVWILSKSRFDLQPYIVLDWKREELFERADRFREMQLGDAIPTEPGVYIIRPLPGQEAATEAFLWNVWKKGETGLYVDEGYSINPRSEAFKSVLTQGRSLRIPVLFLSQRPSHIPRFIISESTFFFVFALNDAEDRKRIQQYIPKETVDLTGKWALKPYHSYWYDIAKDEHRIIGPVPSDDEILDVLDMRLAPKRKVQ